MYFYSMFNDIGLKTWVWWYESTLKKLTGGQSYRIGSIQEHRLLKRFISKVVFITAFCHIVVAWFLYNYRITLFHSGCLFTRALFFSLRIWVYSTSFLKKGRQEEFLGLILTTLPWPHTSSSPLQTLASSLPSLANSSTPSLTSFLLASTSSLCLHHCYCSWSINLRRGTNETWCVQLPFQRSFIKLDILPEPDPQFCPGGVAIFDHFNIPLFLMLLFASFLVFVYPIFSNFRLSSLVLDYLCCLLFSLIF